MRQKMRAYTDGEEGDGLVNATQRRHIDGLATNSSLGANTGRVFTGTSVDNSIDENLWRNKYRTVIQVVQNAPGWGSGRTRDV